MGQLKDHIDSVHQEILQKYKMDDIALRLISRAKTLTVNKDNRLSKITDLDLSYFEWFYEP